MSSDVKTKVLVAEDSEMNRMVLESFLRKFHAQLFFAEDGNAAVEQIKAHPEIDMIFMDIFMPEKNGVDAAKEIRALGYKGAIVACTAEKSPEDIALFKKAGIDEMIGKPYAFEEIKSSFEKYAVRAKPAAGEDAPESAASSKKFLAVWNTDEFSELTGGDFAFASSLIDEYLKQAEGLFSTLKKRLSSSKKDSDKIKLCTHTLKGSSATVFANKIAALSEKMDALAKEKNWTELAALTKEFERDFAELKNYVNIWKKTQAKSAR